MSLFVEPHDNISGLMRPVETVMDISRLGCLYPYPLSFMRSLLRRVITQNWKITPVKMSLCSEGYGHAVYEIETPRALFSYVIFAKNLDVVDRSDRVIAQDWDMTVTLCEGEVDEHRLKILRANVPLQEKGRVDASCFVLSRANKSVRNFEAVVSRLAAGQQPNLDDMAKVGYLYRTTAVYGSGKFGMADWNKVKVSWPDFSSPFDAEMFSCWMIRHFSLLQADHVAASLAPETAVKMDENIKRYVGIGNATGLGMAPYLINHPLLINSWIEVRETALATVLAAGVPDETSRGHFVCFAMKAMQHLDEITTDNPDQNTLNANARADLDVALRWFMGRSVSAWSEVTAYAEAHLGVEAQELINVLLLELYPELIHDLESRLAVDEIYSLNANMRTDDLKSLIEAHYDWALAIDYSDPITQGIFWYRSEEKMEPRLGRRFEEDGAGNEMLLGIGWYVSKCYDSLSEFINSHGPDTNTARFVFHKPEHRYITRRMQTMAKTRYGEIRINAIDLEVLPIQLLRCKLSFFGVGKFDPRSRMWVRNTMFQGAPLLTDIGTDIGDSWCFPIRPQAA